MSKHGDAAKTRKNKRSPWDVVHPGRAWALDPELEDKLSPSEIEKRINDVLNTYPPRTNHASLVEEMLQAFQQIATPPPEIIPPLQDNVGPDDDEAGGLDDD